MFVADNGNRSVLLNILVNNNILFGRMTTATIMRSKQTTTTPIGRSVHTARSQYNGGVIYPQWMRSLEEKYQKLHMKIARSTTAMSNIYNSSLGRTVYQDKTFLKASPSRQRDTSPSRFSTPFSQNRRVTSSLERGVSRTRIISVAEIVQNQDLQEVEEVTSFVNEEAEIEKDLEDLDEEEAYVRLDDAVHQVDDAVLDVDDAGVEVCVDVDDKGDYASDVSDISVVNVDEEDLEEIVDTDDVTSDNENDEVNNNEKDTNDIKDIKENDCVNLKERSVSIQEPVEENKIVDRHTHPLIQDSNKGRVVKGRESFITQLGKHYQSNNKPERFIRREQIPRTSTSRRSIQTHKTSKSCPATMEHVNTVSRPQQDRVIYVRSRSSRKNYKGQRNSNMFSRMSMEAQHARTEILKEKNPVTAKKHHRRDKGSHEANHYDEKGSSSDEDQVYPIPERRTSNAEEKFQDKLYSGEDFNKMFDDENGLTEHDLENAYSDSEISVGNRKHTFAVLAKRTKLPNINDEKYVTLQRLKTLQYTLPGIGRYSVAPKREATFEITPPGFDIRYKDMVVLEERESETPPPEIRDKAVQKCQEWLSRYTPR